MKRTVAIMAGVGLILGTAAAAALEPAARAPRPLDPTLTELRVILGVGDPTPTDWSGKATVDRGEITGVEGLRFRAGDISTGQAAWKAKSRLIRRGGEALKKRLEQAGKQAFAKAASGPSTFGGDVAPNGVLLSIKDAAGATLTIDTAQGRFSIAIDSLADGAPRPVLDGRARIERVFPSAPIAEGPGQQDFPAAAPDGQSGVWVAGVWHEPRGPEFLPALTSRPNSFAEYQPTGGGDQIRLVHLALKDGVYLVDGPPIDVTPPGRDVWRPAVATARDKTVFIAWSENEGGDWNLRGRRLDPATGTLSAVIALTDRPGADADCVLAPAPDGSIWIAWQAWIKGQADILLAPWTAAQAGPLTPIALTETPADEWSPSIAVDSSARVHVAFDSYQTGDFDVVLRTREPDGTLAAPITVAGGPLFQARPSIAADAQGRVWVAYESRTPNWGKDASNLIEGTGSSLYRRSNVEVACVDGRKVARAPDPFANAQPRVGRMNAYARLAVDRDGRPWLAFRHRQEAIWGANATYVIGAVWTGHVTSLSGRAWTPPRTLSRSDGLLDNRAALVQPGSGPMLIIYSTDGRLRREVETTPALSRMYNTNQGSPPGTYNVDLEASALTSHDRLESPRLAEVETPSTAAPVHPQEAEDLERIRGYRITAAGKTYRLLRGEFHRHSEISADGGSDGSLEDMWRYAIDAGGLDWIGDGDHDNGGGKEYTWWLVQKTTDLYTASPRFTPMYCYERSNSYPHGHRNAMFDHRGVRTLPRLVGPLGVVDADTLMFYDYLKEHGGVCASHTSATGMGTDWRDMNPELEPMVEIFQGHRQSYEYLGAPRGARRPGESIGGWRPLGMVWNALAMQYKIGFQASSDHISTHISYAVALAEDATRPAILDAFRRRHCYAATDNIIMDVRSGDHVMGDEFIATGPVALDIVAHGTGPIARVDVIKDFRFAYSTEPRKQRVAFRWTDDEKNRPAGLSWYYVRVIQEDGQIAWASPLWVHQPAAAAE